MPTPESAQPSQPHYKPDAWQGYTISELGFWVHLLVLRAAMRSDPNKKEADLAKAQVYLDFMQAHITAMRS